MSIIRTALSPVEIGGGTGRLALFYANRDRASVIFHDSWPPWLRPIPTG